MCTFFLVQSVLSLLIRKSGNLILFIGKDEKERKREKIDGEMRCRVYLSRSSFLEPHLSYCYGSSPPLTVPLYFHHSYGPHITQFILKGKIIITTPTKVGHAFLCYQILLGVVPLWKCTIDSSNFHHIRFFFHLRTIFCILLLK